MSLEAGTILEGVVVKITHYGAFVELPDGKSGLVHISEIADTYVKDVREYLKEQDRVKVKVLGYNDKGKLDLSIKQALDPAERQARLRAKASFEEKLAKFMRKARNASSTSSATPRPSGEGGGAEGSDLLDPQERRDILEGLPHDLVRLHLSTRLLNASEVS